ncbi:MAG: Na+:solute symporter [Leptospiraceae bacterium]|nr:Na+:solute symporter [Leptospiraceae bacterium]
MTLASGDWIVIILYFSISLGLGLFLARTKTSRLSDYFLSGRQGHWLLLGTGMVATTFGADTPLTVAGLTGSMGISGNWLWWSAAIGGMFTVWFYARLWRRAAILTDLEFIEIRYSGPVANFLRGFKSIYFGFFLNLIVMAWVNLALLTIIQTAFPATRGIAIQIGSLQVGSLQISMAQAIVIGCAFFTLLYSALSGLWGVMIADAFQFVIALLGCILLAWFSLQHDSIQNAGGLHAILPDVWLDFFPDFSNSPVPLTADPAGSAGVPAKISLASFLAYVLVQWWASWYPGAEPGGGGYVAQRIMSARDEKHGLLATLWFIIAHYCIRSWPWILAGLAVLVIYPELHGAETAAKEAAYVQLMRDLLPVPFKGLLLAAFLGAYMSTISTHLNWGASYLINDFYKRFVERDKSDRYYIRLSQFLGLLLIVAALVVSFGLLSSIKETWDFLLSATAGMGFVLLLRWYWWRVNAVAELTSMIAPVFILLAMRLLENSAWFSAAGYQIPPAPQNLFIIVPLSIVTILIVQYASPAENTALLQRFYDRIQPPGPGWRSFRGTKSAPSLPLLWPLTGWLSGTTLVYAGLFFPGALLLQRWELALWSGVVLCISLLITALAVKKEFQRS